MPVPASDYAEHLGVSLIHALGVDPAASLTDALAGAIRDTAAYFGLTPGASPSSTVAIARVNEDQSTDVLVLGDTQIATPDRLIRDDRLAKFAPEQRTRYRERLVAGQGYDDRHRELLRELQAEQARHRNRVDGYWIAEAEPDAADHAITDRMNTPWLVLATDGAYRPMGHLDLDDWEAVAGMSDDQLADLLDACHHWEERDRDGTNLPRSKRHDDKSLAVVLADDD